MIANVEPGLMVKMSDHFCEGVLEEALDFHYALSPLYQGLFIDPHLILVKKTVSLCGMAEGPVSDDLHVMDGGKTSMLQEALDTHA
ncbi:MAG: dihydrodipicolinate synthase family protein [Methanomicrobiales archaeon]